MEHPGWISLNLTLLFISKLTTNFLFHGLFIAGVTARSATTVFRGRHIIRRSPNLVDHTRRIRRPNEIGGASNFGGHTFQTVTYFGVFTHRILRPTENRDHRIWQPSRVSGGHIFRCVQPPKCVTYRNSRPPNSATVAYTGWSQIVVF